MGSMIVLDTNVLSELAKAVPDRAVMAWANSQFADELYATAISEAEMLFGIDLLPQGRRRGELERAVRDVFARLLKGRVLPFDRAAAEAYAMLASARRQRGRPVGTPDLQIASIAHARKASFIVTRNTADFADGGTPLINPWKT
jgi:predicted nucleic acid-binding protein